MTDHLFLLEPMSFTSRLLQGNPMGNPVDRTAVVLHPRGRTADNVNAELIVYVLDGYFGNGRSMLSEPGPMGCSFAQELLSYQDEGIIPPSLFVFVDGSTLLGGSQYVDSAACGPFARHIAQEIVPFIEERLGVAGIPRAVMGHSSGGYGSLRLAMQFPGFFSACICSASDSAFEYSLKSMFPKAAIRLAQCGGIEGFLGEFRARHQPERCSPTDFQTLLILAMASCYSPAPNMNAAHCLLPFDPHTLDLIPSVWSQWLAFDPVHFSNDLLEPLKLLDLLVLDCGSEDEYAAQFGHRQLAARLTAQGIKHHHLEFAGSHSGTRHRYRQRLTLLGDALKPH